MTRTVSILAAAGVAAAATSVASANPTRSEVIQLGNFSGAGGASLFVPYVPDPANNQPVIGVSVSFDFAGSADGFTWASDLQITFEGWGRYIGGFDGVDDLVYSFDGPGSNPAGHYDDTANIKAFEASPFSKSSLQGFTLLNDFSVNATSTWNNIVVTLHKVPTPGATALLGIAGLAAIRRRR